MTVNMNIMMSLNFVAHEDMPQDVVLAFNIHVFILVCDLKCLLCPCLYATYVIIKCDRSYLSPVIVYSMFVLNAVFSLFKAMFLFKNHH